MTEIQRYLAEEVAEDLADGIITRREAIRRLGLLGVTGAAATGLLATFATGEAAAAGPEIPADQDGGRGRVGNDLGARRPRVDHVRGTPGAADGRLGGRRQAARRRARHP